MARNAKLCLFGRMLLALSGKEIPILRAMESGQRNPWKVTKDISDTNSPVLGYLLHRDENHVC
jgi:hypothetical protein